IDVPATGTVHPSRRGEPYPSVALMLNPDVVASLLGELPPSTRNARRERGYSVCPMTADPYAACPVTADRVRELLGALGRTAAALVVQIDARRSFHRSTAYLHRRGGGRQLFSSGP